MRPESTDEILDLIDGAFASAAVGLAMELGLFWRLEAQAMDGEEVARVFEIPPIRAGYWLQLLCSTGLLERGPNGYQPTSTARRAILEPYSQETWALLAREARERLPVISALPRHVREPASVWQALGLTPPMYLDQMAEDPDWARQFTRMLYELHEPLAAAVAESLDLRRVKRLMDLGGGSGVVALALLRRNPQLSATVVDIANVCAAGREIAARSSLGNRIVYQPADFLRDELPKGFDVILECDVNVYNESLFAKVRGSLNPGGRFLIVDQLAPALGVAPPARLHWALAGSMSDPTFVFPTATRLKELLARAGFRATSETPLPSPPGPGTRFTEGMVVIEATKKGPGLTTGARGNAKPFAFETGS